MPLTVLQQAQHEMLNYDNTGMSVMEMSHRSTAFEDIINTATEQCKSLLNIPNNYSILFMQGGGM